MGASRGDSLGDVGNDFFGNVPYVICGDGFHRTAFLDHTTKLEARMPKHDLVRRVQ